MRGSRTVCCNIDLVREIPEAMKPRKIEIRSDSGSLLEGKAEKAA